MFSHLITYDIEQPSEGKVKLEEMDMWDGKFLKTEQVFPLLMELMRFRKSQDNTCKCTSCRCKGGK